jgi:hypothetical protein
MQGLTIVSGLVGLVGPQKVMRYVACSRVATLARRRLERLAARSGLESCWLVAWYRDLGLLMTMSVFGENDGICAG